MTIKIIIRADMYLKLFIAQTLPAYQELFTSRLKV